MSFFSAIVDTIFPPLCFVCNSPLSHLPLSHSRLCTNCWELSQVIDPKTRCIHCFKDCDTTLCGRCAKEPELPYPRAAVFEREAPILRLLDEEAVQAFAGFAYYQWQQLALPDPDYIVPVVPSSLVRAFAMLCNKPCSNLFRRRFCFGQKARLELREGLIPEDATLLLFDPGCKQQELEEACSAISEAFPKRVSILSLAFSG